MKKIIFLLFFSSSNLSAGLCTLAEIKSIDTASLGSDYSPYPWMTKATLGASLLPLIPHLDADSEESAGFHTVTLVGLGGLIYFSLKSIQTSSCEDPRKENNRYQPNFEEVLNYHHREKDLFWKTYLWSGAWMLGIIATTNFDSRKSVAAGALVIPWLFAGSKKWSAFAEDQELQLALLPLFENNQLMFYPSLVWNF